MGHQALSSYESAEFSSCTAPTADCAVRSRVEEGMMTSPPPSLRNVEFRLPVDPRVLGVFSRLAEEALLWLPAA